MYRVQNSWRAGNVSDRRLRALTLPARQWSRPSILIPRPSPFAPPSYPIRAPISSQIFGHPCMRSNDGRSCVEMNHTESRRSRRRCATVRSTLPLRARLIGPRKKRICARVPQTFGFHATPCLRVSVRDYRSAHDSLTQAGVVSMMVIYLLPGSL